MQIRPVTVPITVVETNEFRKQAATLFSKEEIAEIVQHVAYHPFSGVIIPGTGGVRKLRWALEGRGKRGGARVVYFHHGDEMPVFLFSVFSKGKKSDLTMQEQRSLRNIVAEIVAHYTGSRT